MSPPASPPFRRLAGTRLLAAAMILLGVSACAGPQETGAVPSPHWPHTRIVPLPGIPPELTGRSLFWGSWIASDPERGTVLSESSDPRFLLRLSFEDPRRYRVLDLGPDASVETLVFLERGRIALLVGSVGDRQLGTSIYTRALLRFDLEQNLLVDHLPLSRSQVARGLAVDPQERRAFLLLDDGAGNGAVETIDLFGGRTLARREVGAIPSGVRRRGLVADRNARSLFCLSGGEATRSDFAPVGGKPEPPGVLVLDAESLSVETRIPLDEQGTPIAVAYDPDRDRLVVLEAVGDRSRVVLIDAGFREVRDRVGIDDRATDLVLEGGYAFLPGPRGVAAVDLDRSLLVAYSILPLDRTGELAVSPGLRRAFVLFQGGVPPGPPGIAVVGLDTGTLVDVLQ